jgi:hypothetical protein
LEYSFHFDLSLTFFNIISNLVLSSHQGYKPLYLQISIFRRSFYDFIFRATFFSSIWMKNIVLSKAKHESWKLISFPVPLPGCHEVCWKMKRLDFHSDSYFSNKFLLKDHILGLSWFLLVCGYWWKVAFILPPLLWKKEVTHSD